MDEMKCIDVVFESNLCLGCFIVCLLCINVSTKTMFHDDGVDEWGISGASVGHQWGISELMENLTTVRSIRYKGNYLIL
jgi:hypothetical protein